jgi:hypothetical protein
VSGTTGRVLTHREVAEALHPALERGSRPAHNLMLMGYDAPRARLVAAAYLVALLGRR